MLSAAAVRDRNVPLVFGYGGGVNTMAALILLHREALRPDLISFADTRGEKPRTYEYRDRIASPWLLEHQFPKITVVTKVSPRTGDESLEAECLRRETMPSRAFGLSSCAMRWKVEPQDKFLNHWPPAVDAWARGEKPIKILGIDAGEGHRAKHVEDDKLRYWYPLVEFGLDREDCVDLILSEGLPVPPKSACFFCPSSTKPEIIALASGHPELMERALRMEAVALTSARHSLQAVKGLGRHWSWREVVGADSAALARMPERSGEPCTICLAGS